MALHILRTHRLRRELASGTLTEQDSFRYMLLSAVLYVWTMYSGLWFGASPDWRLLFEGGMVLLISLIGTHECFKANGGNNGTDFIRRFCALAVPVGAKLAVLTTVLGQVMYYGFPYVVTPGTFRDPAFVYRLLSFVIVLAYAFIYYWRIAFHLGIIASKGATVDQAL